MNFYVVYVTGEQSDDVEALLEAFNHSGQADHLGELFQVPTGRGRSRRFFPRTLVAELDDEGLAFVRTLGFATLVADGVRALNADEVERARALLVARGENQR
jgi:hypothetical protein